MTEDTRKSLIETLKGATREQWSKLASGAIQRFDTWQNAVTGFGTSIDKTTYSQFVGAFPLNDQQLSNLYHGDDLAARMVDVVPDEMLREGFSLDLEDTDLSAALTEHLDSLRIDSNLADGWRWGRLYGGSALLLGADDGRPASSPLVPERSKALSYLYALDRRYLWPLTYYTDRGNPKLGKPETYMVSAVSAHDDQQGFAVVHETRLVLFGGASTGIREREQNNSWDYSVLHRAVEVLRSFNTGWKAVEILLTDANQAVFKMQGMAEMISAEGQEAFKRRMQLVDMCRSVMRAMVVDGGGKVGSRDVPSEEFLRHSVSFDSIPQTLDKFMLRLAAAVQIPVTILMGQSPAGMNATGDSDFRWFYDRIKSEQTRKLAPIIRRIARVALQSKQFNRADSPITVKFPPLWTETPLAAAQTRAAQMTTDAAGVAAGIWLPEEVALQRGQVDGYERDLLLSDEARKVREAVVKGEYTTLTPDNSKADVPDIELAPTDAAQVIKVNEARASMKLPPLDGPDGELTLAEFAAKAEPEAPAPSFGGAPFGKPAAPKPPGDGPPPPFAKGDPDAKLDADDYERDEAGRFTSSGGGSAGSGASENLGKSIESRHEAEQAEHEDRGAALDARHEAEMEEHIKAGDAIESRQQQESDQAQADDNVSAEQFNEMQARHEAETARHEKLGAIKESRHEAEQKAHEKAGDKLNARHEAEQEVLAQHESAVEEAAEAKSDHDEAVNEAKEERDSAVTDAQDEHDEAVSEAKSDLDTAREEHETNRAYAAENPDDDDAASDLEESAAALKEAESAHAKVEAKAKAKLDKATARADEKLVKAHAKAAAKMDAAKAKLDKAKQALGSLEDRDGDGRTGKAEEQDDK